MITHSNSASAIRNFFWVSKMTSVSGVVINMSGGESEIFFEVIVMYLHALPEL